jgi:hypothetical protein
MRLREGRRMRAFDNRAQGGYFHLKDRKGREAGEHCLMRGFNNLHFTNYEWRD